MADPNATKQALAAALKTLSRKTPLDKISVTDICKQCGVNRKSFYYHFQDKYDLVNWIFDSEFSMIGEDGLRNLLRLLEYLYENRVFYRRAMNIKGQNSFSEHFRERMVSSVKSRVCGAIGGDTLDFRINFYADGFICAIERWLLGRDTMPPGKMYGLLTDCISEPDSLREALTEA